jgi:hypothetical protein
MIINQKENLNQIKKMKTQLIKDETTVFTRKEFIKFTSISSWHFNQALQSGLIVDTGNVFANLRGAPTAYTLADAFLSHIKIENKYSLNQEDVNTLLKAKESKLIKLNDSINVMKHQIDKLEKQKSLLTKIELV